MCYIGLEGNGESVTRRREIIKIVTVFVKIQRPILTRKSYFVYSIKFAAFFSKINSYVNINMTISFLSPEAKEFEKRVYDETLKAMWGKTQPLQIKEENDNGKKRARNR